MRGAIWDLCCAWAISAIFRWAISSGSPVTDPTRARHGLRSTVASKRRRVVSPHECSVIPISPADAVQQAFMEAVASLRDLREPAAFAGWFRCIVIKQADRIRRRLPRHEIPLTDHGFLDLRIGPEEHLIAALERDAAIEAVRTALDELTPADREILRLRYVTQLDGAAMASAVGLTPGAARKRLHDARRRLGAILRHHQGATMTRDLLGKITEPDDETVEALPTATGGRRGEEVVSTGVKVIDAMAPLLRGGTFELSGPAGCGQLVTALEVATNLVDRSGWVAVFAFPDSPVLDDLIAEIERTGVRDRSVVVRGGGRASDAAARIAGALRADGHDVLLLVDNSDGASTDAANAAGLADGGSLTVGLFSPAQDAAERTLAGADTDLVFSAFLAVQRHYPAINVVRSRSRAIEAGLVAGYAVDAVTEVRGCVHRAHRLQSYLAQSLRVAEPYAGVPGEVIERDEAVSALEAVLHGSLQEPSDDELRVAIVANWA